MILTSDVRNSMSLVFLLSATHNQLSCMTRSLCGLSGLKCGVKVTYGAGGNYTLSTENNTQY